jgi:ABC-type sugar transport system ATPase subunit
VAASRFSQRIATLSGGNQQKVLLARWAARDPELFLLNEPTRGIDVKTREAIHRWVESLADSGRCVLLVSSDTQELIRLADRYGADRLDAACAKALAAGDPTYKTVKGILVAGVESAVAPEAQ